VRAGGFVILIGGLAGFEAQIPLSAIRAARARLQSISVGSVAMFEAMNRAIEAAGLRPVIDEVFPFDRAKDALTKLQKRRAFREDRHSQLEAALICARDLRSRTNGPAGGGLDRPAVLRLQDPGGLALLRWSSAAALHYCRGTPRGLGGLDGVINAVNFISLLIKGRRATDACSISFAMRAFRGFVALAGRMARLGKFAGRFAVVLAGRRDDRRQPPKIDALRSAFGLERLRDPQRARGRARPFPRVASELSQGG